MFYRSFKQGGHVLFHLSKVCVNRPGHKGTVKRSVGIFQRIRQHMLVEPVGFAQKPFHAIALMSLAQTLSYNKPHEAAEGGFIHYLKSQSHISVTKYVGVSFKETVKVLSASQYFYPGQGKIITKLRSGAVTSVLFLCH